MEIPVWIEGLAAKEDDGMMLAATIARQPQ
jgi:hypothetical protein